MKIFKITIFAFLILAALGTTQTVYVPVNHWVYDYIDRMETKRHIPVVLNGTKPMTRSEISGYVQQLENFRDKLSRTELEQLDYLLFEFQDTGGQNKKHADYQTRLKKITQQPWIDSWLPDFVYPTGRHFLEIEHGPLRLNWDPLFYRSRVFADDDTLSSTERVFTDTNGFLLWGTVGPWFGFYTDVRDTREWGTRQYAGGTISKEGLGFVVGNRREIYHDETTAYLTAKWEWLLLQFGKDENKWGPGFWGQLALSDNATSYDQFKIQVSFPNFKYTAIVGWLRHYTPSYYQQGAIGKMIALHRAEFSPWPWIDFGIAEAVVYSRTKFEPAYANPMMFLRSAEHYLGDQDNALMSLDLEIKAISNIKIYGEILIDDITTSKLGTGFYGNKYGFLAGVLYTDFARISNFDLRIEYSKIRPYVYSHKYGVTSYQHFSTSLGHWNGPHSDVLNIGFNFQPRRRLSFALNAETARQFEDLDEINLGGNINFSHLGVVPQYVKFGEGIEDKINLIMLKCSYEIMRNTFVEFSYRVVDVLENKYKTSSRNELILKVSMNIDRGGKGSWNK